MSTPLLIGLLVMVIVVVAAAGVWRARTKGSLNVQSSIFVLLLAAAVGILVFYLLGGGF